MKKINLKISAVIIAIFGLYTANASAQTCTVAPTCEALGFTKTVAECTGHTTLNCPFDNTKVYCDTACGKPAEKVWKLHDTYYGKGKVFRVSADGKSGKYISMISTRAKTIEEAAKICFSQGMRVPIDKLDEIERSDICKFIPEDLYGIGVDKYGIWVVAEIGNRPGNFTCKSNTDSPAVYSSISRDELNVLCVGEFSS